MSALTRRIAGSPLARTAAMPVRAKTVATFQGRHLMTSAKWLVKSREHTNFTYDLSPRNQRHLAWWVSTISGVDHETVAGYIRELQDDEELRDHILDATAKSARRGLADMEVRFGRRLGWYALTRAMRPQRVVETGTDKGLGSCIFAAALLRNGSGRLTTIDVNPDSGYLITGRYGQAVDRVVGDSIEMIEGITDPIDLFLHDSWHTWEHETSEFRAALPRLAPRAVVLSDNAHSSDALLDWAESDGRTFSYFGEVPEDHWYPGSGIGAAWDASS